MATKSGRRTAGGGPERSPAAMAKSISNALREEAERDWASSDRRAAKGVRRKQAAAAKGRVGTVTRDTKIGPRKGKPAPAGRGRGSKSHYPASTAPIPRPAGR